jgi:hypothetical protein
MKYADRYRLPFTLEELKAKNNEGNSALQNGLDFNCKILERENYPSRPFSAQYYDKEDKPLFFYFGVRWYDDQVRFHQLWVIGKY